MDSEDKQRISLYLDKDLVAKADKFMKEYSYRSRNEFYSAAAEFFITEKVFHKNEDQLNDKLAKAVAKLSEDNAKAISKAMFRYAVQLEMVMRMIAELSEYTDKEIEILKSKSIKNVRNLKGRIRIEDIMAGKYNE